MQKGQSRLSVRIQIDLKSLTDFGVSVRYPDDFYVPDLSEATYYAQVARELKSIVLRLIKFSPGD